MCGLLPFGSAESFAGVFGYTGLELLAQCGVVEITADDHQLIFAFTWPLTVVNRESLAGEMEHVAPLTFVEPEDAFGAEYRGRELIVEEVLELAQREGAIASK